MLDPCFMVTHLKYYTFYRIMSNLTVGLTVCSVMIKKFKQYYFILEIKFLIDISKKD